MEIIIDDITLRKWKLSDLDNLVKYANNKKIADNLTDAFPHPYNKTDGKKFISSVSKDKPLKVFSIVINGEACGAVGVFVQSDIYRKNAEIGYWLAEKYWGKGIMTKIIMRVIEYGFETWDIIRIFAKPFSSNIASHRVLEKAGMKPEARLQNVVIKNGQLKDEYIYSILKEKRK